MTRFVELSHVFEDGMPGPLSIHPDGTRRRLTASVKPWRTHAQARAVSGTNVGFEATEVRFPTALGTYLDAPYTRYPDKRDIGALTVDELVLPGALVDLSQMQAGQGATLDDLMHGGGPALDVTGKAVLCRFGWDQHWGSEAYDSYPFLARETVRYLVDNGARLVGVDTPNIDDRADSEYPAHSWLLEQDILVVENLCNLAALEDRSFRFFAIPIRARGAASMTVRAFAELGRVGPPTYKFLEQ